MSAAIFYEPEAYSTSSKKLMGRNAAGESFLNGLFKYTSSEKLWLYSSTESNAIHFSKAALRAGCNKQIKWINPKNFNAIAEVGCLYYPGPNIVDLAINRQMYGNNQWSISGITHTTCSSAVMSSLSSFLNSPIYPWDSLICTSQSVKSNVETIFEIQSDFLKSHLGAQKIVLPKLPVIPLGVHSGEFIFTDQEVAEARQYFNANSDTLIVIYFGRLSFHAKAHPFAMYKALQNASLKTQKEILLLQCGWFGNDSIKKSFEEASNLICPNVTVQTIDGRLQENRKKVWSSGDIFCSFSDNIQETFGITPIEAMSAGLPVVLSDWDGYRESVTNEEEGFLIPTHMPSADLGKDLIQRYSLSIDTYDMYIGHCSSLISIDIEIASNAFEKLFNSTELRIRMGNKGRQKSKTKFDWSVLIPKYEDLWSELASIRFSSSKESKNSNLFASRLDPFYSFAHYSTFHLKLNTVLKLIDNDKAIALERYYSYMTLSMINYANYIIPDESEIISIFDFLSTGEKSALEIISIFKDQRKGFIFRGLNWLMKFGFLVALK